MLVLRGRRIPVEEEKLRSHQSDALSAGLDRSRGFGCFADVANDFDPMPIGEDGRLVARGIFFISAIREIHLEALCRFDVRWTRLDVELTGGTIQDACPVGRYFQKRCPRANGARNVE